MEEAYNKLIQYAEERGCTIVFDDTRRISFSTKMIITIPREVTAEAVFALAHEIGHLIDFLEHRLDHEKWLHDDSYRVTAEMSAWVNAHRLLTQLDIPLEGYRGHVRTKLSSYFVHDQVI
ncbi:hypothetical protein [Planococcus lenghuensis]|uniref:IrrE N-terminal-like domain-containing protein n=1 Tax=Planococcus lenghuensis TaxID=2213202 RepID=A0A1Q2KZR0_9BACL|nr:hypothetical protein [Planococcus lenghuensis]AQQ53679.1 hypothetical protein B0X71_11715 [Planococcus lenghuensis]